MRYLKFITCFASFYSFRYIKAQVYPSIAKSSSDLPSQNAPMLIPKIFHHIWFDFGKGSKVFTRYEEYLKKLKELHPGWTFISWDEKRVLDLIQKKRPDFLKRYLSYDKVIKKHDAARIIILNEMGGVYADHDFEARKNIEPLLKSFKFVVGSESSGFDPSNGFIASVEKFKLLDSIINYMNQDHVANRFVISATGPQMLKETISDFIAKNTTKDIKIYTKQFFYPINYYEKKNLKGKSPREIEIMKFGSYLCQTYDGSWID